MLRNIKKLSLLNFFGFFILLHYLQSNCLRRSSEVCALRSFAFDRGKFCGHCPLFSFLQISLHVCGAILPFKYILYLFADKSLCLMNHSAI